MSSPMIVERITGSSEALRHAAKSKPLIRSADLKLRGDLCAHLSTSNPPQNPPGAYECLYSNASGRKTVTQGGADSARHCRPALVHPRVYSFKLHNLVADIEVGEHVLNVVAVVSPSMSLKTLRAPSSSTGTDARQNDASAES
jgi:hypothetical protein